MNGRTLKVVKVSSMVVGIVLGAITISGATARGALYLAVHEFDKRYITQEAWITEKRADETEALKSEIRELRIKKRYGETTPSEEALLEELILELEEKTHATTTHP